MRQLFAPGADAWLRFALLCAGLFVCGAIVAAYAVAGSGIVTGAGITPAQPVPFSHKHHVSELGIDCRYCHTSVEQLASAGMPSTQTCITCHSQIWSGAPMLAPVRDSFAQDAPLHWARVNRLPGYVYFNHAIHVTKGVGCTSCHAGIADMQLTYKSQAFTMSFCLSCHRDAAAQLRTPAEVWDMHWTPPPDQATRGAALAAAAHLRAAALLTDCSTCHR